MATRFSINQLTFKSKSFKFWLAPLSNRNCPKIVLNEGEVKRRAKNHQNPAITKNRHPFTTQFAQTTKNNNTNLSILASVAISWPLSRLSSRLPIKSNARNHKQRERTVQKDAIRRMMLTMLKRTQNCKVKISLPAHMKTEKWKCTCYGHAAEMAPPGNRIELFLFLLEWLMHSRKSSIGPGPMSQKTFKLADGLALLFSFVLLWILKAQLKRHESLEVHLFLDFFFSFNYDQVIIYLKSYCTRFYTQSLGARNETN